MPRFSDRVPPAEATVNSFTAVVGRLRASGAPLLDLTGTNPTTAGFHYSRRMIESLGDIRSLSYAPHPLGLAEARAAVAASYPRPAVALSPNNVMLTASTSEAYSFIFKLLCDSGDDVLVPFPSYPLFEHLARLDSVLLRRYPLEYHGQWSIDFGQLEQAIGPRTRAVIVVAPNNPTGSLLREADWARLAELCARRGLAVVCDEVFLDYLLEPADDAVRGVLAAPTAHAELLVFSLGGLSKAVGLPQHKLGWMILQGRPSLATAAMERLEWIGDTYLSVNTPVQMAAASLLTSGVTVRNEIRSRLLANLAFLRQRLAGTPSCSLLRVEGGWSVIVRVPATDGEGPLALQLAAEDGVLVHPGYFYDFSREAHLVVSLLTPPDVFVAGIERVCRRAGA